MTKMWIRFIAMAIVAAFAGNATGANQDWPQFRGPRGDNHAAEATPPLAWSETNNIVWKIAIPGRGRSSPVVLGDGIWLTTAIETGVRRTRIGSDDMQTAEHVVLKAVGLDRATGKIRWVTELFDVPKPEPVHWLNSWATPTPVVEAGRLYCDFGNMGTACLEADTGKVLWKVRVPCDHQVGPGSSPAVFGRQIILVRDGREEQFITALDKSTGKKVWRTDRPPLQGGSPNAKKSFCSPLVFEADGRMQMVVPGPQWVVSYDPLTGREHWRARHGSGFSIGASAVFGHGMVFFSTGCMKAELHAVRADGAGDVSTSHYAWKSLRNVPVMPSPLLVGDELYWVSDDGMASCADARTGSIHWQERLGGSHLAAPVFADGRIYFFGQSGQTTVTKAGNKFEKLGANSLEGIVVGTPAFVGKSIFHRTDTHLYRIDRQ